MKRNLGKILLLILLSTHLFSAVVAKLDKYEIQRGEGVTLSISAEGKDAPKGKDRDFILEMKVDKKEVFIGEPIKLTVVFKRNFQKDIANIKYEPPKFENLWVKKIEKKELKEEGKYLVHTLSYLLFPQKSGILQIEPARVDIARKVKSQDKFFVVIERLIWRSLFSNSLKIRVKALPNSLEVYGSLKMDVFLDKNKTIPNNPVNLTINISGSGNIDDIKEFELNIPNATVFADKPKRESFISDGEYKGSFTQKFAIVSDSNFTIPAISFLYFDKDKNKTSKLKSKTLFVEVESTKKTEFAVIQKPKDSKKHKSIKEPKESRKQINAFVYLMAGFFMGIVFVLMLSMKDRLKFKSLKVTSLQTRIKKAKSDKELIKLLLPFAKNKKELSEIVTKLEENIYMGKSHKIKRKEVLKILKELHTHRK